MGTSHITGQERSSQAQPVGAEHSRERANFAYIITDPVLPKVDFPLIPEAERPTMKLRDVGFMDRWHNIPLDQIGVNWRNILISLKTGTALLTRDSSVSTVNVLKSLSTSLPKETRAPSTHGNPAEVAEA